MIWISYLISNSGPLRTSPTMPAWQETKFFFWRGLAGLSLLLDSSSAHFQPILTNKKDALCPSKKMKLISPKFKNSSFLPVPGLIQSRVLSRAIKRGLLAKS